jgi:ATP-binding cassette, subfamily B, bacterial
MTANQKPIRRSENPFRSVLIFIVRQWWREGRLLFGTAGAMIAATLADILLPVYAGQLVDAVANSAANRNAALDAGLWAPAPSSSSVLPCWCCARPPSCSS